VLEQPAGRVPRFPDLASVDRAHRQVLEDQRFGDVDRRGFRRNAEEDDVTAVPHDPERVVDRFQRAGHLEHDAHPDVLVLLEEPRRYVLGLSDVHDVFGSELSGELEPEGHVIRREQPPRAEGAGDRDREEPDRPAPEHGHGSAGEILRARRENGVAERLLEASDLRRELRAIVAPDDGRGDRYEVGKPTVAVDPEDQRLLAHVRPASAAVEARPARDVALGRDVVTLLDITHLSAGRHDRPTELVSERERWMYALGGPLIPAVDVEIRAADACRLDPDENLVRPGCRDRYLVEHEARLGLALAYGTHRLHG
jgi:hypothetical protein